MNSRPPNPPVWRDPDGSFRDPRTNRPIAHPITVRAIERAIGEGQQVVFSTPADRLPATASADGPDGPTTLR
jgi:hypothetical protein